jgi:hypothetical protein
MHPQRFSLRSKGNRERKATNQDFPVFKNFPRMLLRVMVLCTAILAVFQLRVITDPVDFYLKVAGDFDSPAFQYEQYLDENQTKVGQNSGIISLYFYAKPEGAVMVKQNEEVIGVIGAGTKIEVKPGTIYLDARQLAYPITVNIVLNEKSYQIDLNKDVKCFDIQFKSKSSS